MAVRKPAAKQFPPDEDERLLIRAAQKDPARFGDLYEQYFESVYAFVTRRVRDRDTAEDLTSEVFQKALANLGNYEIRGAPFAAWLMRIAANAVIDQSKRAAREVSGARERREPAVNPDMEAIENRARIFRLVNELPKDQRRVIFERFVEQKSVREIAQQLARSEGAVKQLQLRALQSLRSQMEGSNG